MIKKLINLAKVQKEAKEEAKIKFIRKIDVILQDEEVDERDRKTSFTICECMKCHWKFIGDCERHGEGVQTPHFCPMCGSKFSEGLE